MSEAKEITLAVLAGAAGGEVAKAAAKDAYSVLKTTGKNTIQRLLRRWRGPALAQAEHNIELFDRELTSAQARDAIKLERRGTQPPIAEDAIGDPDNFHAFCVAARAAARTSSSERHKVLAEALAMRFRTPSQDAKAVVLTGAIEVVSALGSAHLATLGLLACIQGVRPLRNAQRRGELELSLGGIFDRANQFCAHNGPRVEQLRGEERVAAAKAHNEEGEAIMRHARPIEEEIRAIDEESANQILTTLRVHRSAWNTPVESVLHLGANGCLVLERAVFRDLSEQFAEERTRGGLSTTPRALAHALRAEEYDQLRETWDNLLQHCALTPVGFVIGLMVHDMLADTETALLWEWGELKPVDRRKESWGGRSTHEVTDSIVAATKRSIRDDEVRRRLLAGDTTITLR